MAFRDHSLIRLQLLSLTGILAVPLPSYRSVACHIINNNNPYVNSLIPGCTWKIHQDQIPSFCSWSITRYRIPLVSPQRRHKSIKMTNVLLPWILSALLSTVTAEQPSAPSPVAAPMRSLPWGDLNFLQTTDTHGWQAGHLQEYVCRRCSSPVPLC